MGSPDEHKQMTYITGITALNIPLPSGVSADWHTSGLANTQAWSWSGRALMDTCHLLGDAGIYDATHALRPYAPDTPKGTLAASYERAVFDLPYQSSLTGKAVPNIQCKDIEDIVNMEKVKCWIQSVDLSDRRQSTMLAWIYHSV